MWRASALLAITLSLVLGCTARARAQAPFQVASLAPLAIARPSLARRAEPFGLATGPVAAGGLVDKWMSVERKLQRERKILARCRAGAARCPAAAKRFLVILDTAMTRDGLMRVAEVIREDPEYAAPESLIARLRALLTSDRLALLQS